MIHYYTCATAVEQTTQHCANAFYNTLQHDNNVQMRTTKTDHKSNTTGHVRPLSLINLLLSNVTYTVVWFVFDVKQDSSRLLKLQYYMYLKHIRE